MPKITFTQLSKDLKKGVLAPVYLFTGDDVYRKREVADKIKEIVNPDDFNFVKEDASSCNIGELISLAGTAPVFNAKRLIVLNNADKLKKAAAEALASYLENPLETTCLVIMHNDAKKAKKDKTLEDSCSEACVITAFDELKSNQLGPWIEEHLAVKGFKIEPEALILLQEIVGSDLVALNTEIEKLSLYLLDSEDKTVRQADILASVGLSKEENPFALSNAVLDCNRQEALKLAQKLLDGGEEPVSVLNKISACALKMLRIKRLSEAGLTGPALLQAAGLLPWESRLAAKAYIMPSSASLCRALDKIIETDMAFKSSSAGEPSIQIKGIILTLLSK
ncbi:DNA polymerase III subunit delta [Candidatus Proelusimicrobium excrementi]|uniref:DNA polymerase III subunit delta n=1 Tax=Candidatus Proelusimicrobium excrementi TaxID=3416222 RepID=UPI003D0B8C38